MANGKGGLPVKAFIEHGHFKNFHQKFKSAGAKIFTVEYLVVPAPLV